ncbi:hypothetical protein NIES4071_46340 [Calothrix sp. NIES-4071]|nr:hypothetical protein NIES4071_46340 [Calothrix sp. NIES-4071]BAZ58945.1 hypothetical protein NIES4105_46270 [Calothrix sp. NIES-4105]
MLKTLLLSGWFRTKPFLKYALVVMLIAPLAAASSHATSTTLSEVKSTSVATTDSIPNSTNVDNIDVNQELASVPDSSSQQKSDSISMKAAVVAQPLAKDKDDSFQIDNYSQANESTNNSLAAVELAPPITRSGFSSIVEIPEQQSDLIQRLKAAKAKSSALEQDSLIATKVSPVLRDSNGGNNIEAPSQPSEAQQNPDDPLGSAYPIPMKWITATTESMAPRGGGVRYYRSVPVISPDGRYAVYSRIQLEVKPETHNSRVSSVLFIEDRQTKNLKVLSSTSRNSDVLINIKATADANGEGTIGVLVPVSWSEKGDRFLARRFEGVMNTSDVSDYAVIWHREKNSTNTVGPAYKEQEHEKISILLGWSKTQPNHVLFRAGEMGDENWALLSVSDDGKTSNANEVDQPVTFGKQASDVWAGPQVAYR